VYLLSEVPQDPLSTATRVDVPRKVRVTSGEEEGGRKAEEEKEEQVVRGVE